MLLLLILCLTIIRFSSIIKLRKLDGGVEVKKTFVVRKSALYDDGFADVIEELADLAAKDRIPEWESYDTEKIERSYPVVDYYISLHAGPVETPGRVVATAYIHTVDGEDQAEVTITWEEAPMTAREFLAWAGYEANEGNLFALTRYIGGDVDYSQFPDAAVVTQDGKPIADCDEEPARFQDWVQRFWKEEEL